MVRKRLYAKRTASAEYEQLDLFGLLEEEQWIGYNVLDSPMRDE